MIGLLRLIVPPILAFVTAWAVDRQMARRGLLPPFFRRAGGVGSNVRRALGVALLALLFWIAVFASVGLIGLEQEADVSNLATPALFLVHAMLLVTLVVWYVLGFAGFRGSRGPSESQTEPAADADSDAPGAIESAAPDNTVGGTLPSTTPARQFGMSAANPLTEIGLGAAFGLGAWVVVVTFLVLLGVVIWWIGGEDALPQEAPAIVPWIAGLPILVRIAVSASAGFFEELFFRGFLQPRTGIPLSTTLFVLAHMSYAQPMMLVGVTVLSLIFAFLVHWRRNIWAAVTAHAVFDAVQLLFVIPWALRFMETGGSNPIAPIALIAGSLLPLC